MVDTVTIAGGGNTVSLSLSNAQFAVAKAALDNISSHYQASTVYGSDTGVPIPGQENVYDIDAAGGSYTLPAGGQILIAYDTPDESQASVTLTAGSGSGGGLLIGNNGNDTFNVSGGSGNIVAGDGTNAINISSGAETISAGAGSNTISASGNDTITLGSGNDTITLGSGSDTLNATSSATVYGGSGSLYLDGREGTSVTAYAGSGAETIFGGSGTNTFYGSSTGGSDYFVGGPGKNTFYGGDGHDTLVASGSAMHSDLFVFSNAASVSGGQHVIDGFTFSGNARYDDTLELKGYTQGDVDTISHSGGNTTIVLNDHASDGHTTSITLNGVSNFTASDIVFKS